MPELNRARPLAAPAISVVIPVYGAGDFLAAALASVFHQTLSPVEVIVVDDGSPDAAGLDQALAPVLERIRLLRQPNRGPAAARNLGIRHARGEFIAFLDGDDLWEPDYLARQIALLQSRPGLDMVFCDARLFGDTPAAGQAMMELYPPKAGEVSFETLVAGDCPMVFPSCLLLRREVLVAAGLFEESLRYSEDIHLCLRLLHGGVRAAYQRPALVRRRAWPGSLSAARERGAQGELIALEHLRQALPLSPPQAALLEQRLAWRRAGVELRAAKALLAAGRVREAIAPLARANTVLRRRKLRLLLAALAFAPGPAGQATQCVMSLRRRLVPGTRA